MRMYCGLGKFFEKKGAFQPFNSLIQNVRWPRTNYQGETSYAPFVGTWDRSRHHPQSTRLLGPLSLIPLVGTQQEAEEHPAAPTAKPGPQGRIPHAGMLQLSWKYLAQAKYCSKHLWFIISSFIVFLCYQSDICCLRLRVWCWLSGPFSKEFVFQHSFTHVAYKVTFSCQVANQAL